MKTGKGKIFHMSGGRLFADKGILKNLLKLKSVIAVSIVSLIIITALGIYDFTIPLFIENFAENLAIIGIVISLGYIVSFLSEIPIGKMTDKLGRIKVLIISLICLGIVGVLFFFANSIWLVILFVLTFGFSQILFWVPSTVMVRDFSPKGLTSQAQGLYLTLSQVGWIVGPLLAGIITSILSEKYNFLAMSVLMLAGLFATFIIFRKRKERKSIALLEAIKKSGLTRPAFIIESFKKYVKAHKHAAPLYILTFICYVWIATEWTFVVLAGINVFHFSETAMGILLSAMMCIEGILMYSSGFVMDKIGKKYIITAGLILLFASTYFMFLSPNFLFFAFFVLLAAGATSWILPGTEALLTEIMPANIMGEMSGVFDTSKDLGFMVGPAVGGILAEVLFGALTPFLFVAILAGIGALMAGWIFWPQYNKPSKKKTKLFHK